MGCRRVGTLTTLSPDLTAPVLAAASLELKAEKCGEIGIANCVAFSPDGTTIVLGSWGLINVWELRPVVDSEWEEVDISGTTYYGEVRIDGLGYISSNYWRNTVTGGKEKSKPSGGAL